MWVDWAFFKIVTIIGWGLSLWSIILAWTWIAETKRERCLLNQLYQAYERFHLSVFSADELGYESDCFAELKGCYELFPALIAECRKIKLESCYLSYRTPNCAKSVRIPLKACFFVAAGASPKFCINDGEHFTYSAEPSSSKCLGDCTEPLRIRVRLPDQDDTDFNSIPQDCYSQQLVLKFVAKGSYFKTPLHHFVRIPFPPPH